MPTIASRRRPVLDPLALARMRALRLVVVPWAEEELALLQETAAAAGRRLISVAGHHGAHALMLGWPADVDPMAVLGADGEDLPGATPTTCLVLAACIGCCWPSPDAPLLPGIPVPEKQVLDTLASFTRASSSANESFGTRQTHWKSAIRRLRASGFLVPEEGGSLIRLGPALAGWGDAEVRHLRDRYADLPRLTEEPA
jgi:hypothetical protein